MSDGVAVREEGKHLGFLPDVALHGCQTRGPGYIPCVLEDKNKHGREGVMVCQALEMQAQRTSWSRGNGMAVHPSYSLL